MRRMDYPIAKAKELNLNDKEWFLEIELETYTLKKKLPNGIYHLTGYSDAQDIVNIDLFFYAGSLSPVVSVGCKALLLIPSRDADYQELNDLLTSDAFDDGLLNGLPYFSINPESPIFKNNEIYLIVKDGIVLLTFHSEA
jgi:hypothetical protein